ncbi:FAD-dependent monooxygenase [Streptomyces sp. HPF1205]|uniref:FAD-dependent monooxygenase n=1 Tax=Streptomyces sp. HPF1205 TaxID=2873262 RepID=UPI001CEC0E02|nr:FAD-dependent monooxygenase [Streptomyces sp. HPF1205]
MKRVPVLVVGAGPVGLALACALWQRGVRARIVEAEADRQSGSRAVQLHPPTLQLFRELGVLDEAERLGLRIRSTSYHLAGGRTVRVVLGPRNEPLMLPQEHTARLLEGALELAGGRVERGLRVTDVTQDAEGVSVETRGPDGTELIEADWLVATDGVRSTVRDRLGVDFAGSDVTTGFVLAEGRIGGDFERNAVHYFLGQTGSVVFASMPGGRTRISAPVPEGFPIDAEGVQRLLDTRGPGGLHVTGLDMISSFTSQERIAVTLRKGRCFLAGDAAHTHSPLGGQGLNLGLQDAHNLAWKLAGVVTGTLAPAILDTYGPERHQAAEQIVRNTHLFLTVFRLGPAASRIRDTVWAGLEAAGVLRQWFVPLLAGWRVRYPDLLGERGRPDPRRSALRAARRLPAPGGRAPAWVPEPPAGIPQFRLVARGPAGDGPVRAVHAAAAAAPVPVVPTYLPGRAPGFLLLRPDGYVLAAGTTAAELAAAGRLLGRIAAAAPVRPKRPAVTAEAD